MMINAAKNNVLSCAFALCMALGFSEVAAASCFDLGQRYATSNGATLVAAEAATQDGAPVCKVVVLKQSSAGERPKREIVYLPN